MWSVRISEIRFFALACAIPALDICESFTFEEANIDSSISFG